MEKGQGIRQILNIGYRYNLGDMIFMSAKEAEAFKKPPSALGLGNNGGSF